MGATELTQMLAVVIAALVYVSKVSIDGWKNHRNGRDYPYTDRRIQVDVHKWLSPMIDPKTQQPIFVWKTRAEVMQILDKLEDVTNALNELVTELGKRNKELTA